MAFVVTIAVAVFLLAVFSACGYAVVRLLEGEPPKGLMRHDANSVVLEWESDEEGASLDCPTSPGDVYDGRYTVHRALGRGSNARVWLCRDDAGRAVALKLQRRGAAYERAALREIEIMRAIDECDGVVRLLDCFSVAARRGVHVGMVLELQRATLLDVVGDGGLPLHRVRRVARSLLETLEFVHDRVGALHGDIKPENVLVDGDCNVKLADFGTSSFIDRQVARIIQTREYRCPEAIVGAFPFTPQADIWSLGCLLFECATTEQLFVPDDSSPSQDEAHLGQVAELIGPIPHDLARGDRTSAAVAPHDKIATVLGDFGIAADDARDFASFLALLLKVSPSDRVTARHALSLPWLRDARGRATPLYDEMMMI